MIFAASAARLIAFLNIADNFVIMPKELLKADKWCMVFRRYT